MLFLATGTGETDTTSSTGAQGGGPEKPCSEVTESASESQAYSRYIVGTEKNNCPKPYS
jgi:hypothetical protein